MFYCEPCRVENNWPKSMLAYISRGMCEICETVQSCYDIPSKDLPLPKGDNVEMKEKYLTATMEQIAGIRCWRLDVWLSLREAVDGAGERRWPDGVAPDLPKFFHLVPVSQDDIERAGFDIAKASRKKKIADLDERIAELQRCRSEVLRDEEGDES